MTSFVSAADRRQADHYANECQNPPLSQDQKSQLRRAFANCRSRAGEIEIRDPPLSQQLRPAAPAATPTVE
ncbi:hypothetical protein N7481_005139 [Penicillium waksmanii]|uniref:uncharacterized protein n=1 Tax=Penicillium waksmanii TaxID=69791 RepID=UPI0025482A42|nr:uncharacterized protein N7481_005139 [Penicillium waksmanii]KAJ5983040.1 hypothetical protein N7481_005139 [Penicillium waksmanii]